MGSIFHQIVVVIEGIWGNSQIRKNLFLSQGRWPGERRWLWSQTCMYMLTSLNGEGLSHIPNLEKRICHHPCHFWEKKIMDWLCTGLEKPRLRIKTNYTISSLQGYQALRNASGAEAQLLPKKLTIQVKVWSSHNIPAWGFLSNLQETPKHLLKDCFPLSKGWVFQGFSPLKPMRTRCLNPSYRAEEEVRVINPFSQEGEDGVPDWLMNQDHGTWAYPPLRSQLGLLRPQSLIPF